MSLRSILGLKPRGFNSADQATTERTFFYACADKCRSLGWQVDLSGPKPPFKITRGDATFHVLPAMPTRTMKATFRADVMEVLAKVRYAPTIVIGYGDMASGLRDMLQESGVYFINYEKLFAIFDEIYLQDKSFRTSRIIRCFGCLVPDVNGHRLNGWVRFVDMVGRREPVSIVLAGGGVDMLVARPWPRPNDNQHYFHFAYSLKSLGALNLEDDTMTLGVVDSDGRRHKAEVARDLRNTLIDFRVRGFG